MDWHEPIAYLIVVTLQYRATKRCFTYVASSICFGIGCFLYAVFATKDFRNDLKSINESAKNDQNRTETLKSLSGFIEFYSTSKQLS